MRRFNVAPLWWAIGLGLAALAAYASMFAAEHRGWVTAAAYALVAWSER